MALNYVSMDVPAKFDALSSDKNVATALKSIHLLKILQSNALNKLQSCQCLCEIIRKLFINNFTSF